MSDPSSDKKIRSVKNSRSPLKQQHYLSSALPTLNSNLLKSLCSVHLPPPLPLPCKVSIHSDGRMTEPTIQDNTSDETNWSDKGSFHVNPKIQPHQFTPQSIQRKKQPFVKQDKNAIPSVTTATTATTLSSSSEPIQGLMFATPLTSMSTEFNDFKLIKPTKAIKTLPLGESTSTNRLNVPNTPQSLQRGDSLTKSQSTLTGKPFGTYHKHPTNQDENSVGLASSLSVTPTTPKGKTTEPSLNISASFRKSTLDKPPQILFKIDPHGTQSLPPPKSKGVTHSKLAAPPSVNHVLEPIPSFDKMPAIIDDGKKPPFSYATLIGMAILRSPERKLTLSLIYQWINDTYEYYRTSTAGWQNSIRHNLSLNKAFQKQERPKGDPGKGNYWIIVPGFEYQFMKSRSGKRTSQQKNVIPTKEADFKLKKDRINGEKTGGIKVLKKQLASPILVPVPLLPLQPVNSCPVKNRNTSLALQDESPTPKPVPKSSLRVTPPEFAFPSKSLAKNPILTSSSHLKKSSDKSLPQSLQFPPHGIEIKPISTASSTDDEMEDTNIGSDETIAELNDDDQISPSRVDHYQPQLHINQHQYQHNFQHFQHHQLFFNQRQYQHRHHAGSHILTHPQPRAGLISSSPRGPDETDSMTTFLEVPDNLPLRKSHTAIGLRNSLRPNFHLESPTTNKRRLSSGIESPSEGLQLPFKRRPLSSAAVAMAVENAAPSSYYRDLPTNYSSNIMPASLTTSTQSSIYDDAPKLPLPHHWQTLEDPNFSASRSLYNNQAIPTISFSTTLDNNSPVKPPGLILPPLTPSKTLLPPAHFNTPGSAAIRNLSPNTALRNHRAIMRGLLNQDIHEDFSMSPNNGNHQFLSTPQFEGTSRIHTPSRGQHPSNHHLYHHPPGLSGPSSLSNSGFTMEVDDAIARACFGSPDKREAKRKQFLDYYSASGFGYYAYDWGEVHASSNYSQANNNENVNMHTESNSQKSPHNKSAGNITDTSNNHRTLNKFSFTDTRGTTGNDRLTDVFGVDVCQVVKRAIESHQSSNVVAGNVGNAGDLILSASPDRTEDLPRKHRHSGATGHDRNLSEYYSGVVSPRRRRISRAAMSLNSSPVSPIRELPSEGTREKLLHNGFLQFDSPIKTQEE